MRLQDIAPSGAPPPFVSFGRTLAVAWHSSDAKSHRENGSSLRASAKWSEAIQSEAPPWIASSLSLLAMTRMHRDND